MPTPPHHNPKANRRIMGIDGAPGGWIAVSASLRTDRLIDFETVAIHLAPTWTTLPILDAIVAVDMPIGLPDEKERACDAEARRILGKKHSSVFAPPRRPVLQMRSWETANAWSKAAPWTTHRGEKRDGCGLTKQAWNLVPKIREVDHALGPGDQDQIFEVHPEVAFARRNGGEALSAGKKTPAGQAARRALLGREHLLLPDLPPRKETVRPKPDDLIDAGLLLLVARDLCVGTARLLPARPGTPDGRGPRDARGLAMEIWY